MGRPANTTQNGPARIVTLSASSVHRNVTLAQGIYGGASDLYDARVRSTGTSLNGTPSTRTDPGTLTTDLTHVVVTRDTTGAVRIYRNGEPRRPWDRPTASSRTGTRTTASPWDGSST